MNPSRLLQLVAAASACGAAPHQPGHDDSRLAVEFVPFLSAGLWVSLDAAEPLSLRVHREHERNGSVVLMVDGRHVQVSRSDEPLSFDGLGCGKHSLAVYQLEPGHPATVEVAEFTLPCNHQSAIRAVSRPANHEVGVYYTTYNGLLKTNGSATTVESVLRDGKPNALFFSGRDSRKIVWKRSRTKRWTTGKTFLSAAAPNYWQHEPTTGFYCLYRARAGETGVLPDCPGIAKTLAYHAEMLLTAGVDYIMLDATNCKPHDSTNVVWVSILPEMPAPPLRTGGPWPSEAADVTQMRPTEVIFEEWHKLRMRGKPTPRVAVWNRVDVSAPNDPPGSGDQLWQVYLDRIYNNESYSDLLLRSAEGKKVFFVVWFPWAINQTALRAIEWNGGRDDVVVVHNWLSPTGVSAEEFPFWLSQKSRLYKRSCCIVRPAVVLEWHLDISVSVCRVRTGGT